MIELRAVETCHLSWLKRQRNRPEVMDFCRQPFLLNEINQDDWFKKVSREKSMIPLMIVEGDTYLGYAAFSNIDWIARRAEFSIFISPEQSGKGYGRQAIFLLMDYGFKTLGFQKICSETFEFNKGELEILKEIGFQESGRLVRHYFKRGRLWDAIIVYMLKENYDEIAFCNSAKEEEEKKEGKPL